MADDSRQGYAYDPRWPWWVGTVFRFSPPSPDYERQTWGHAVLQHEIVQDFMAFVRSRIGGLGSPHRYLERVDEQGYWFPLMPTLVALDIHELPVTLLPLPQPRLQGPMGPNEWIISFDLDAENESSSLFIPLGLILSRLAPVSPRPMAQVLVVLLTYRVLPVCARYGGPATWGALDQMLNPAPQP